jgi:hypothetical protein
MIDRWERWVQEMETHPLDEFEYLGALQKRDEVEEWLQISGNQQAIDEVANIDARFDDLTEEDGKFASRFSAQAGLGWWWNRVPSDPASRSYIFGD